MAFKLGEAVRLRRQRARRRRGWNCGRLILLFALLAGHAVAQAPPALPDPSRRPPLQNDPTDYWADVHRWTGSDATRPQRGAAPPATAPLRDGARRVTTSATARANIRREPSTGAPVLRSLRPGTALIVAEETPDGWLQVLQDGRASGWIHQSALQAP